MMPLAAEVYNAAQKLDDTPIAILNGGAAEALRALQASAPEARRVADAHGVSLDEVYSLWERATARLSALPQTPDDVFPIAGEAASLLYTVAWLLDSEIITAEDLSALI
jgi:hypothetical protein